MAAADCSTASGVTVSAVAARECSIESDVSVVAAGDRSTTSGVKVYIGCGSS